LTFIFLVKPIAAKGMQLLFFNTTNPYAGITLIRCINPCVWNKGLLGIISANKKL
jgi:hypothetical protein